MLVWTEHACDPYIGDEGEEQSVQFFCSDGSIYSRHEDKYGGLVLLKTKEDEVKNKHILFLQQS
mgnify:CR=1 FL=1